MVKSLENGTSLPPFLVKCYEMVSDESTDGLISWTESNDSFIIWDESEFSSRLLPKYFKHSNFSSFVRQLNIYGFRKVDTDRWQFANESFIKGQKHLLKNITRRKQPQNVLPKKSSQWKEDPPVVPKGEDKRTALWKEVESLKTDKNALMQELKKLRQHQQMSQSKLQLLHEQLKGMEKNQQQMLSFIVMAMQSPEFLVQFFQPKENNWLMAAETGKSKLSEVMDDGEPVPSEGMIVPYQPPKDGPSTTECAMEASTPEDLMELDFSADEMRDLFVNIDFLLGPLDEKLLPENPTQIVLPDILESDTMLEQLLLSEPSDNNGQLPEFGTEACTDSTMQMGSTFHLREADNSNGSDNDATECMNQITVAMTSQSLCDDCEKAEVSTKQMEYLNSEMGFEH